MTTFASRWGVLRHREFRWFFLATTVNRLGSMMTSVAYAFAVLHVSNSAQSLSKVLGVEVGANVACVLFGGVVADRFSRRVVLQSSYLSAAAGLIATAVLLLSGQASVPRLMMLGAVTGAASAFAMPAIQGIVPQLVPRADLQQANAVMSFVRNGAQLLGPVLGAILVAAGGAPWALIIDGCTFLAASALLLPVRLPQRPPSPGAGIVQDLREGWGEFISRTWLWVIVVAFGILNAILAGTIMVLGPLVAKNTPALGVKGWGWVMGAEAAGMLLGSLVLIRVHLHHPLLTGMTGVGLTAFFIVTLGLQPTTAMLMGPAFLSGFGAEIFGTGWNVALGEHIPSDVLSRVSSYDLIGSFVATPVGMLVFGALATRASLGPLLTISGAVFTAITLATLLVPSVRNMTRLPDAN